MCDHGRSREIQQRSREIKGEYTREEGIMGNDGKSRTFFQFIINQGQPRDFTENYARSQETTGKSRQNTEDSWR